MEYIDFAGAETPIEVAEGYELWQLTEDDRSHDLQLDQPDLQLDHQPKHIIVTAEESLALMGRQREWTAEDQERLEAQAAEEINDPRLFNWY